MNPRTRFYKQLSAAAATVALTLALPSMAAAAPDPDFYPGNPTCASIDQEYGGTWTELKVEPPVDGTYTSADGKVRVTVDVTDGKFFSWTAVAAADGVTRSLDAVIAKGGPDGNAYVYQPPGSESFGDTGLHSPPSAGQEISGLSHISFCYDLEQRIQGVKFEDTNANGQQDAGELPIPGDPSDPTDPNTFTFELVDSTGTVVQTTTNNALGGYSFEGFAPGTYTVREASKTGWYCSAPVLGCVHTNLVVGTGGAKTGINFGNYRPVEISGRKFRDLTANGVSSDDTGWDGVTIKLDPGTPNDPTDDQSTTTATVLGVAGSYKFSNLRPGVAYRVYEVAPSGSVCTSPNPCSKSWLASEIVSGGTYSQNFANFVPAAAITVTKQVDKAESHVGDTLNYSINVTNTGNTSLTVTLTDLEKNTTAAGCTFAAGAPAPFVLAPGASQQFSCTKSAPDQASYVNEVCVTSIDQYGNTPGQCAEVTTTILKPRINVVKSGTPTTVHDGDSVVYSYAVSIGEGGNTPLEDIHVSDDKCSPVNATETGGFNVGDVDQDGWLDLTETWSYTCDYVAKHSDEDGDGNIVNTVVADGTDKLGETVDDDDDWTTAVIHPNLALDKKERAAGESQYVNGPISAQVGTTIEYEMTVTNPGDTPMDVQGFTDDRCDAGTLGSPSGDADNDGLLDTNEAWVYHCSHVLQASDPTPFVNVAAVTAKDTFGGDPITKRDQVETTVVPLPDPPLTPPAQQPAPEQVVAGDRAVAGTARLLGPTGCAAKAFNLRVRGTKIAKVVFRLDGKRLKTLTKPNARTLFQVRVNPAKMRVGVHRVVATITFERGSGTKPRTLRLSFQRCARRVAAPRFTG